MSDSSDNYYSSDDETVENFVLVEFEDGVQLVHRTWLIDESKCYWPNPSYKSNDRYFKAVESGENPTENWIPYNMKILGSFSDWSYARRKLKTAEATSDINTTENEDRKTRKDRKRKLESDDEVEARPKKYCNNLPKFPEVPVNKVNLSTIKAPSNVHLKRSAMLETSKLLKRNNVPLSQTLNSPGSSQDTYSIGEVESVSSRELASPFSPLPCTSAGGDCDHEWKKMVIQELSTIKLHLRQIFSSMKKSHVGSPEDNSTHENEVLQNFPMKTMEDFGNFELKVEQEIFKRRVIYLLGRCGGSNVREITKSIFKKIMIDDLASQFSWHGGKGKKALVSSPVADILFMAVRSNRATKETTDAEIISLTKNWLRHAPERSKQKKSGSQD